MLTLAYVDLFGVCRFRISKRFPAVIPRALTDGKGRESWNEKGTGERIEGENKCYLKLFSSLYNQTRFMSHHRNLQNTVTLTGVDSKWSRSSTIHRYYYHDITTTI